MLDAQRFKRARFMALPAVAMTSTFKMVRNLDRCHSHATGPA